MKLFKLLTLLLTFTILSVANGGINNPFLWEVKKGEQTLYLFGTMHLGDPKLQVLPQALKIAIDKSDEVRTEIPMDASLQMKSVTLMMRSDNRSLQEIIPKTLYQRTEKYIQQINPQMNLIPFDKMKIWALSAVTAMLENQLKYPMLTLEEQIMGLESTLDYLEQNSDI